jgi:hypothetical protein
MVVDGREGSSALEVEATSKTGKSKQLKAYLTGQSAPLRDTGPGIQ